MNWYANGKTLCSSTARPDIIAHRNNWHGSAPLCSRCERRLTPVLAYAAALLVADDTPTNEPAAVTGGTAEHHRSAARN
jgi:hypothetical protein